MDEEIADFPQSLRDPGQRDVRMNLLNEPHMKALTEFARTIRAERVGRDVPNFDPLDGGKDAECLFVLEAPGPKARDTRFVSRNNPDPTAKNWFKLNQAANIARKRTILWNIVPWYLGDGQRIRPPTRDERDEGLNYLLQLIEKLPALRIVVLVGGQAGRVRDDLADRLNLANRCCHLEGMPHPAQLFINRHPENWQKLLDSLIRIAALLDGGGTCPSLTLYPASAASPVQESGK